MNKMSPFINYAIAAVVAIVSLGFAGCVNSMNDTPAVDPTTGEANKFDFATKRKVTINLQYDVPSGYRVFFEMFTKSPLTLDEYKSYVKDQTLVPFLSGRSDLNGLVSLNCELPASVREVYAYSTGIGVPVLLKATVNEAGAIMNFQPVEVKEVMASRASTPSGTTFWKTYDVTLSEPTLPAVSRTISKQDKSLIDLSFPENQDYDLHRTYYGSEIQLKDKARIKIYSVTNGVNSNRTNALAYYVSNNNEIPVEKLKPEDINSKMNLIFPVLDKTTPAQGQGFQLLNDGSETFEAGSVIGFALFPDITPGNIQTTNTHVLYSTFNTGSWNTYSYPGLVRASVPHMVLSVLRTDENGHAIIALGFEDQPWSTKYGTNKGNFRDDIFILEVDPVTSLPDDLPQPPTDEPTYDMEFASSGIYCFEDCWPAKGDYDINDAIIAYDRITCIKNLSVAALKETYTFLHNGATYVNGFGFQLMGAKRSDVTECTVTSDVVFDGQGLDMTSDQAIVMLYNNSKHVPAGTTFTVFTSIASNALLTGINPFIVTAGDYNPSPDVLAKDRIEVHFATPKGAITKYLPTNKSISTLWNTKDDKSIPASNIYYVREGNYPFALELNWISDSYGPVTNFVIPKEGESIEITYPQFSKWVNSNGKENTDWYIHPNK